MAAAMGLVVVTSGVADVSPGTENMDLTTLQS
jgi:hypothetical protein